MIQIETQIPEEKVVKWLNTVGSNMMINDISGVFGTTLLMSMISFIGVLYWLVWSNSESSWPFLLVVIPPIVVRIAITKYMEWWIIRKLKNTDPHLISAAIQWLVQNNTPKWMGHYNTDMDNRRELICEYVEKAKIVLPWYDLDSHSEGGD